MTKLYFTELADYNIWANNIVCTWLQSIAEEQWKQSIVSSFSSIYETVLHIAASENHQLLTETFNGSKEDLINEWQQISLSLKSFIEEMPDSLLQEKLLFRNTKGIEHNMPYYQLLAHVINHSTYHRGQLVTMLRQAGYKDVSSTDITTFFRTQYKMYGNT